MGWFKRIQDGITTKSTDKKEIPEGAWYKCPNCKTVVNLPPQLKGACGIFWPLASSTAICTTPGIPLTEM